MDWQGLRAVLFDLDGTLYNGETPIPGAADTVAHLRRQGIAVGFVTNTTSRGPRALAAQLARMGIAADAAQIVNPTTAAADYLRAHNASAHLLALPPALDDFAGVRQDDAAPDWVVIGDLGDGWTYAKLNHAFRLVQGGAGLMALGMSRYWRADDGLRLDVGPFVAALEFATGQAPLVLGKPAAAFFRQALDTLGMQAEATLMVGDDVQTDIAGAQAAGLRAALVRTGKFRPADLQQGITPDFILASVADLVG